MSGFSGGSGRMVGDLVRQVQGQQGQGQPPATQPPAGVGPGEPTQGGAYGQQGTYNTLATDMSRGQMGGYGFGGNQFSYQPFGNPYQQQSPFGGMFGRGGYGGGWGGPPPPIMGGQQGHGGFLNSMYQQIGHPGLRNRMQRGYGADYSEGSYNAVPNMMGGGMMGNHQYTGGMGGYGGKPQWGGYGGGGFGGFNRNRMF